MPTRRFRTSVDMRSGYAVVEVHGELDLSTAPILRRVLIDVVADQRREVVVLDCADLTFVDSTGLGVVAGTASRLSRDGRDLVAVNVSGEVARTIHLTGLEAAVAVHTIKGPGEASRPWDAGASLKDLRDVLSRQNRADDV